MVICLLGEPHGPSISGGALHYRWAVAASAISPLSLSDLANHSSRCYLLYLPILLPPYILPAFVICRLTAQFFCLCDSDSWSIRHFTNHFIFGFFPINSDSINKPISLHLSLPFYTRLFLVLWRGIIKHFYLEGRYLNIYKIYFQI